MEAIRIADDIYWVGALDWNGRSFHGYATPRGTSYNAYLILDERNVLIDCVKTPFIDEMMSRIRSIIDPEDIDIIVSNHAEGDHSSGLPLVQQITGADILTSKKGVENLRLNYGPMRMREVEDGQEMGIGRRTLRFAYTPMLHWPDSMFTYAVEDGILFSMDGFGQHFASSDRFDDQVDHDILIEEASIYYANILMPFGNQFKKAYDRIKDWDLRMLATSHGLIWRKDAAEIIGLYLKWADHVTEERAVVIYDTMWGSTERMAKTITDGIISEGVAVTLLKVSVTERSFIMRDVLRSRAVVVGSPTLNNGMLPTVADITIYMRGLRPKGRLAAIFGAYGWGGGASKAIRENLEKGGLELPFSDLEIQFAPLGDGLDRCFAFGVEIAKRIKGE